jgi:hypothetical protein
VDGPQIAEISGPPGEEIYCDKYGRVKVKFLWDLEGPSDDKSSCWIRVSQYWAGTKWGGMALPRIGQEVIVSFLEGDPDQPIVTGRTYNANNMPPYDLPAEKTKMTIKSRTHKGEGFNEFRFEDEAGKEEIFIHAQKDQANVVLNDETTDVGHDRTEHVKNDETITIDNDRLENVKHNETITIDNDRTETVKHNESITIENDRMELVKNDETVTVENDQHTFIKNNQYENVDGDKHNKVQGDRLEKITGSSHLKITGSQNEEITQSVSRDTKMNVQEKMGLKYAVDAGTEIHLKAGLSAVIEATASITLQVGESVININPAGVFIDGPIVLIKSGALAVPGTGSNPDGADSAEGANRARENNTPNTEDIEYDGTVGGDNARHPLETEAAPPDIAGDDAIDFVVKDREVEPVVAEAEKADDGFGVDDTVSMGMDFLPFIGSGKSIAQLISGTDLITGEPTPRWIEAVGILAGLVGAAGIAKGILKGGASVLKHGDEVADVAEAAAKKADDVADTTKNTDEYVTVYRGDRPDTKIIKSKASSEYGYKGAQDIIDNNDLDDLFKLHKESSDLPPSPFISTTSDKKVAEFFAGKDGVVNEFRIPKNRATFNKHNDFVVPAGAKGELISESEYLVPLYIKPSEFIKKGGGK